MATTKRKAFAAELSAALSAKGFSSASSGQYSQSSGQTVIYIAIRDYNPEGVDKEDGLALKKGEKVVLIQKSPDVETKRVKLDDEAELREEIGGSLLDNSAAKYKLSVKPPKNHPARSRDASPSPVGGNAESLGATSRLLVQSLDTEQSGWVPTSVLVKQQVQHYEREEMEVEQEFVMESAGGASEALYCREAIVRELVDTEEEFGRDLQAVVDRYVKPLDSPSVPRTVRDNKDLVFTNLKQITEFHNTVLIEGVKYYADEPRMLGKTFLRLERDFDKHVQYCRDEPIAQEFLQNNAEAREYFEERAQSLGDERSLSEHLKLPIQRIHDYQLLLKDLVKYSRKLGEDVTDLNKALELMLAIPHKASDNKYISNIEGYHGNIHKLGRLLRHDWFKVKFADTAKEKERYLFLFKARILICKVRKIAEDRSVFVLKHIIRLPEVEIKDDTSSELKFELCHKFPETPEYPILLEAHKSKAKTEWLNEIRQYAADILALAEHAADDLRVQQESSTESKFGSLKGVELEISDDIVAEDIEQFTGNPLIEEQKRVKSQLKHVQVPERPPLEIPKKKAIFRFSDEDELLEDEIQCVAPEVERRIEAGELIVQEESSRVVTQRSVRVEETGSVESKKVLQEITNTSSTKQSSTETTKAPSPSVETPIEPSLTSVPTAAKDRSPDTSAVERSPAAEKSPVVERSPVVDRSPVVERSPIPEDSTVVAEEQAEEDMDRYSMRSSGSRYRSVSSKVSEEVYVESSRTGGKTSASSSSRSFAMVEETVNGRTVRKEIMTSGTDSLGDNTDSARIKSYGRTDSVGSGCAIEEISSVRHLDGKTYDNNNEEIGIGGRTTRRGDYGEEITSTSSVRKSSKYSSSTGEEDTSSTRTKRYGLDETDSSSVRTKRASALDEEDSSATRTKRLADEDDRLTKRSALGLDEESSSISRTRTSTSQYAREESVTGKRALDDEETERLTKKTVLDEDQTVRRTKVGISDVEAGEKEGPVFTKPLESYAVKVGEDATLECDVAASVLWLKNNKPIPPSYGDRYFPSSSSDQVHHTLHIMGVRESDEDSFTVRASNEDGAVSYCTTRLTVEHDHQEDSPDGSPKFLIGMKNTAVLEKTFLRFMVKVSGSPKPEVKFYKDDRFITSANQRVKIDKSRSSAGYYELILPQVTEEDAGQYKCIAMNEHGEAESEATLSVTDDKTIFYGLENSDLLKSGETPQFQWLRDGQPFQPEDRFKVDYKDEGDSLQLVFQNVKPEDAGLYTCVGTTSTGRLACSAELTIQGSVNQLAREPMAPKMTAESKTFESSLGSTAMMEFTCEGFPKPYLKLEKDGKEIETGGKCKFMYESDENVILAIKKLEPEDSGKYTVEAMNELGSSTQEFNLSIKAPPKYRNKLGDGEDVNIMVGQELKLSIGIDGIPKPEVKWLKDGKPVKETKDLVLSYDDSGVHTLTIEKATLKDSGSYSVTATNEMSTITDFTRVTVHAPPQFLRTMTKAVDCNIGDTITYQIKVEGDPLPDVKWMKDNEPLQIDEQHLKVTADGQVHSLIINKVKREDSGKYSALITNDHGSSQDDGRMNVRCAPLFTKKLEDFTALEGDQNVEFTVDIECYPKPVVKWFHDKTEITEKLSEFTKVEETDGHTYKLILSQVEREHAGKYICEVSNNLGKLKCDANFVVKAKPRFKKTLPETVEIDEGQSLSLSIEVEAVPEPEVKWYRNGQEITADANIKITRDSKRIEDYHLTVTLVKPEDGGEYEVRASNEVGSAVTKSRVLVHSVTKSKQADETEEGVPAQIIEEKMDARKVFETLSTVFEVIATGYPHPEAVWYKNGEVLEESERNVITNEGKSYKLEIVRTTHSDAGEYSVVVKNRLGEASSKGSLEIADVKGLRSPRIKTPLESLIIHKYEKAQFTAVVIAFPEPDIKWTIAGKDPQPVVEYIVDTKELDYGLLECTFTLLIPNGHHCHTGDVLFVASNDYGSCETGARLDVLLRPEIQALKDLTCEPYQTTAFEVEIDANPKPRVTWSFKGEKITGTDPRVQVTSEPDQDMYRLTIRNVGLGDEGVYEVEASNNLGVASAIARLKVHRPGDGAEDEDGLDSERVKPGSLGSGDTGKPQQGRKADGKGLADENDLDSRRHKPGSLDSEASGKPHKGRKAAYGSDSADEDEGLDSRGVKPRTLDSGASGKPQQGRKADGSGLADENDLDSRRHKPGSLDSDASVKPQRAGKADGKGLADENDLNSRRTKPGSLDSGASGKPERAGKADGRDSADEDEGLDSRGNKPRTVDSDASSKPQRDEKADGKSLADEDDLDSRRGKPSTLDSDDDDRPHHARRTDGKGLADENDLDSRGVKPRTLDSDAAGKPQQGRKTDGKGLEDENYLDSRRHKPSTLDSDDDDKPQRGRKAHGGDSANENDLDSRRGKPGSLDSDASDKPQRGGKADGRGIADENDLDSRRLKLGSLDSEASGKPTGKSGVKSDEDDEGTVSFTVARKRGKPETAGSKDEADSGRGDSKVTLARPYGARSEPDQADQDDTGKPETAGSIPLDAEAKKPEVDESSAGKTKTIEPEGQMPAFIKRLDEQTVREYAPLEAKVRADGIPKPVLKWLKNGDIINEEDDDRIRIETTKEGVVTSTLYISHFAPEHVAKYTVIAANLVGEVECFARFRMADHPPMFTRPLNRSLEVQEGHPIELRAQLEASPLAQLRWTKNGEKLLPSDRIEMSSTPDGAVKLSIHEAQLSDSGAYKLFAFNDNGEMHSMCAVVVDPEDKIPSIAQPLSEVLGYEGEPLKLTALIEGFPIPTITWMKDSHILHSGSGCSMVTKPSACGNYTEVSLILPNPGPKDAGRYSFVAQNKLGDAESATRVEIARKETIPRFSLQLNPGKVIEGYPAKLAVKAYAYPEPELQWTFNNHPFIPDGIHSRIITDDDGTQTLLIDKTLPDDAGVYAVMATNNRGTASTRGILDVQPSGRVDQEEQAPGFVHNFKDLTVDEDTPIDFSAPFVGNPIPQVEWFKDGIPLIPSKRLQFTCDGLKVGLNIAKAEPVDAGKYTCTLENKHGKASSSGEIQVRKLYQAPHFLQKFTDQQQLPKRDAKFLARVTGVPTPTVQWYRDGVAIESDDKYRIKRDDEMVCLYVRRCSLDDEAEYKVVAKNREGEVSCEARLKVVDQLEKQEKIEPPSFLKRIGDIEVYPGMSAKFTACMTGYPVPSVEWYKNGEPLEASDKVQIDTESSGILRLTIHRTDLEEDAAIYKCRIWNPHGEATCDAKLLFETLEIRPKAPVGELYSDYDRIRSTGIPLPLADKPIISRMTDRRLTLSWKPSIPYGARYPVTYHVEMCDLPDGDWFTARMGIRSCACDISNLVPFRDYKFRIRVENKYGLSDPSPFAQTMREKLNSERPKFEPYLPPGVPFHPDKSFYFPRDFDLERPPREGYAQAPRFLNQEHDTQYGIKNENSSLFWFVYGYPKPKVSFYFNDELIEMGGRYDSSYTRNGQATLFINKMLDRDVGMYEALASNEHGTARQRVRLEIAEYPHFIVRPEETYVMMRRTCKLEARIWGVPYPEIKWYKDWKPLTESSRHKIQWIEPDHCVLTIGDCIGRDEGLYSVTARNIAGTISHSVTVHVEDNENEYSYRTYARGRQVKTRTKPITDAYDFGDELGRGVTGIVYHAVERSSGRNYAAKVMTGKGNQYKSLFKNELDIMNQLCHRNLVRLHDSYETKDSFTIISELAGGGELLHSLTRQSYYTEYDIAHYIRQLLSGLDYMHRLSIAHLGLTPGDLLVAHPGGRHLLLTDFGLSRRITSFGKLNPLEYGMPEFVAPEIANGKGVGFAADMWSTGVLTYLLLTGVSLFRGNDDAETLTKVKDGHFMFRREHWENISEEARDFISKLIVVDANTRMDVRQALRHPWLNFADRKPTEDTPKLNTDALRNYYNLYKDWYGNAAVRRYYRRRPLNSCYTHPSRMIYPPGTQFTPEPTPDKVLVSRDLRDVKTWEDNVPNRGPAIDYDLNVVKSESHYQNGPDTYLLQLRDVDFPVRLREYIKVASTRPGFNCLDTSENGHLDWKAPVIRERRRFTDVMDEEIDDERRNRINKYGAADTYTLRRLRHEIGTRPEAHVEADALIESRRDGHAPFFREKPITIPVVIGDKLEMKCLAVGEPKPVIQWFKNELVITESSRIKFREDKDGRCIMTIEPVLNADLGIFKIVARNRKGQTVTRCRVVEATTPMAPDSPEAVDISDTEILLRWKQPSYDGHAPVICYSLQFKEADEVDWITLANNIDHEFWHVKDLKRETNYTFRLSAKNVIGWSEKGIPSALFKTKEQGNGQYKVAVTPAMKHLQAITEAGHTPTLAQDPPPLNYSVEDSPIEWSTEPPTDKYQFISEIHRGKFSVVVKAAEKANTENLVAAKLFEYSHDTLHQVNTEFDNLRSLRHERIASLLEAYKPSTTASNIAVLVMEKLQGADVLSYLSSRHEYTEQNVATIISQVLDGLQYLHWRGLCHLNIEPDNVVMASVRSVQVKLIDLGCTQRVTKLGTLIHPVNTPNPEFAAPEVLAEEPIFPQTDVWSAGVLAYVLLSGASPFRGQSEPETRQNVNFVRYRFEYLFKELTQEATRFLMLIFKRAPGKRPTVEECHENRWLVPSEYMIKKRERAVFLGNRLKEFSDEYHDLKNKQFTSDSLSSLHKTLTRSNSIQEELISTAFTSHLVNKPSSDSSTL